jgi:hypothetical protein
VDGETMIRNERVLVLKFLQARDPAWVNRIFFARYDDKATWLNQLKPAFGEDQWWFQAEIARMRSSGVAPSWGDRSRTHKRVSAFGHVEWE